MLRLSTLTVDKNVNCDSLQDFGGSESFVCQLRQFKGMLTQTIDSILVALKATVDRNVNSHCWQNFGSSHCEKYRNFT